MAMALKFGHRLCHQDVACTVDQTGSSIFTETSKALKDDAAYAAVVYVAGKQDLTQFLSLEDFLLQGLADLKWIERVKRWYSYATRLSARDYLERDGESVEVWDRRLLVAIEIAKEVHAKQLQCTWTSFRCYCRSLWSTLSR